MFQVGNFFAEDGLKMERRVHYGIYNTKIQDLQRVCFRQGIKVTGCVRNHPDLEEPTNDPAFLFSCCPVVERNVRAACMRIGLAET